MRKLEKTLARLLQVLQIVSGSHVGMSFAREYMRRTRDVNVTIVPI